MKHLPDILIILGLMMASTFAAACWSAITSWKNNRSRGCIPKSK